MKVKGTCGGCGKKLEGGNCAHCGQAYSREVKHHEVELGELVPGLRNHDGTPVERALVVINSSRAQEAALCAAHAHVEKTAPAAPGAKAGFMSDPDVLANAKQLEAMAAAFRNPDDPKYSLFPSSGRMRDNLTPAVLGSMAAAYIECEKHDGGIHAPGIDRDDIDELVATCVVHYDDPIPELTLSRYERDWLTAAFVEVAQQMHRERLQARRLRDAADMLALAADAGGDVAEAARAYQVERELWADLMAPAYLLEAPAEEAGDP